MVTGSPRATIDALLDHYDLLPHLQAIVTRDELVHGKPDPEGYLLALARLGVPAGRALVYEDSDVGVEAALAAGVDVIDIRALSD